MDKNAVREKIVIFLQEKMTRLNVSSTEIDDNFNLIHSGLIDSLDFIQLITMLEQEFNKEISFDDDISNYYTMSGLIKAIVEK